MNQSKENFRTEKQKEGSGPILQSNGTHAILQKKSKKMFKKGQKGQNI